MLLHVSILKKVVYLLFLSYCFIWIRFIPWSEWLTEYEGYGSNKIKFLDKNVFFDFVYLPRPDLCDSVSLISVVLSTPGKTVIRQAIRDNWASSNYSQLVKDGKVGTVFILSSTRNEGEMEKIKEESEKYGDIILTNLKEEYDNLLYKVSALMFWQQTYCPLVKYILKVDDDVVIHYDRIVKLLPQNEPTYPQVYCKTWIRSMPKRDVHSKWFVAGSKWKRQFFPMYCNGPAYIMTNRAVQSIMEGISDFSPIFIEDVFYTGIVAERMRIRRNGMNSVFHPTAKDLKRGLSDCSPYGQILLSAVHPIKNKRQIEIGSERMNKLQCKANTVFHAISNRIRGKIDNYKSEKKNKREDSRNSVADQPEKLPLIHTKSISQKKDQSIIDQSLTTVPKRTLEVERVERQKAEKTTKRKVQTTTRTQRNNGREKSTKTPTKVNVTKSKLMSKEPKRN